MNLGPNRVQMQKDLDDLTSLLAVSDVRPIGSSAPILLPTDGTAAAAGLLILTVLLVVVLAYLAAQAAPRKDENLIGQLRWMAEQMKGVSKATAKNMHAEARADDRKLEECKEKLRQVMPERVERCEKLHGNDYDIVKKKYLQAVYTYTTDFKVLYNAIAAIRTKQILELYEQFDNALRKYRFCLGCTN